MAEEADNNVVTVKQKVTKLIETSLKITVPDEPSIAPKVEICKDKKFGDYQFAVMECWSKIKDKKTELNNPYSMAQAIEKNLPKSDMIESSSVTRPGFVNVHISIQWIEKNILEMLEKGIGIWAPKLPVRRVVVDFSSPNIAKEMHVGHLRSTIIGDTIASMLEFANVEVLRRNHVGDWGTQFGMLIEYMFEEFPDWENVGEQAIGDLQAFYRASKLKFDADPVFKEKARQAVVLLQGGDEKYHKAWSTICNISRQEFQKIYERLGVSLEEKGESFYNPYIPKVLEGLSNQGLIVEDQGARVILIEGEPIPLIVMKSDGGYNYDSTDLAALWYRLNEEKADQILYVTDGRQAKHFEMVFSAARLASWLPADENLYPKASHVKFGQVTGNDGRPLKTRSGDVPRLADLLDEAKSRSKAKLVARVKPDEWTEEELEQTAEAIGYGAVKYADLKNNRETNYMYNLEQMLDDKGNTVVYVQYAHARICSIIRKSGKDIEELKKMAGTVGLGNDSERMLGLHLVQFAEAVEEACLTLKPNVICDYLYNLSQHATKFYNDDECQVIGSPKETSRLLLCEATLIVMRKCFELLGIVPVHKL